MGSGALLLNFQCNTAVFYNLPSEISYNFNQLRTLMDIQNRGTNPVQIYGRWTGPTYGVWCA